MPDWIPIRIRTESANMNKVVARIEGYPEEATQKYFFQALQSISASAADVMRSYIESNPAVFTPTGEARKASGGNGPGRVKTGAMRDAVKWRGGKDGKNKYSFQFGWIDGAPGYSVFQEYGTKNGVTAMNAIQYTADFVRRELRLLGNAPTSYKVRNAGRWSD